MTLVARREFLASALALASGGLSVNRFGMYGKLTAHPGEILSIVVDHFSESSGVPCFFV